MRKIVIGMNAGFVGTDAWEFYEVPVTITDGELNVFVWQRAKDHAESYGVYPREEYADTEDYDEDSESYSDNIGGWYEDYDPAEHDGHTMTGTPSWQQY
jgi:hypothetical protein